MKKQEPISLDECEKPKQPSKRWWRKLAIAGASILLAIVTISSLGRSSKKHDVAEFVDNTHQFRGKTIAIRLVLSHPPFQPGHFATFKTERSYGFEPKQITVQIPSNIAVPNASPGDVLLVTFVCNEGKTYTGNVATSIRRP